MTTTEQQAFNAMRNTLATIIEYKDCGGPPSFDVHAMWANARAALARAEGMQAEVDTLRQQLVEAQARINSLEETEKQLSDNVIWQAGEIAKHLALIEASRKQEVKGWLVEYESVQARDNSVKKFDCVWVKKSFVSDCRGAGSEASNVRNRTEMPLYAAPPVVADDVLKELLWIRTIFAKDHETGGVVIKDVQGKEISKWIDRVDALGGAE